MAGLYAEDGELTDEGKSKVLEWFKVHSIKKCQVCDGHSAWNLVPYIQYMGSYIEAPTPKPTQNLPIVILVCDYCGNSLLFPALLLGLIPSDKVQSTS